MSSNHGAECNRRNRPFILTSARVSTTARGAAHRRKWLISTPNHAPRCSIHPPPHSAAHLRRRRSEVRPGCRESADEWRGVWSWPTPRVGPGVLLDVGAGPERPQGGLNPPQLTISRAGGAEPAHVRGGERGARRVIFGAILSSALLLANGGRLGHLVAQAVCSSNRACDPPPGAPPSAEGDQREPIDEAGVGPGKLRTNRHAVEIPAQLRDTCRWKLQHRSGSVRTGSSGRGFHHSTGDISAGSLGAQPICPPAQRLADRLLEMMVAFAVGTDLGRLAEWASAGTV